MRETEYDSKLKYLGIKNKYELLEKYLYLMKEIKELRTFKATARERYDKMNKTLITYMDKYGTLDNKKGKNNGVHKQI